MRKLKRPREAPASRGRSRTSAPAHKRTTAYSPLERIRERISRAVERVADTRHRGIRLVRVVSRGVGEIVLESLAVLATTRVGTGEDEIVRSAGAPPLELSGADGVERMLAERRVDELEDLVPPVAAGLVGGGLTHELLDAARVAVGGTARELHERTLRGDVVLHGEQPGAVGRELALAMPLEQSELEWEQRHTDGEGERPGADREQDERDRAVGHVATHDVAELVR